MKMFKLSLTAGVLAMLATTPVAAQHARRVEQEAAYRATREGAVLPLRSIENNIIPRMRARGADYIGAEFNGPESRYRLKFMRGSSVIWVDVDGRNGAVIGRTSE